MNKTLAVIALVALMTISPASAQRPSAVVPQATFLTGAPTTTENNDSCDIAAMPAATLLLPYFEVDFTSPQITALTTLFTVTNTSPVPQIARGTIWTDRAYPVLTFHLFLTGYDVQAINLYDVLARGIIAPPFGTSISTSPGPRSVATNPNFLANAASACSNLPGAIPASLVNDMQSALTAGTIPSSSISGIGNTHTNAIGYLTVDVVATCSTAFPDTQTYFTTQILFDNALIGDYVIINPNTTTGNYATSSPMVHIRAIPEGGAVGSIQPTNLPYTFYDRYTPSFSRSIDRRQPLPGSFAAHYIQAGTGSFNTNYKIWREGTISNAPASAYASNAAIPLIEVVRFDEHENATVLAVQGTLPATSSTPASSAIFPPQPTPAGDVGGWIYINLNNGGSTTYSAGRATLNGASQNWVIVQFFVAGKLGEDFEAIGLGNGCSPAPAAGARIGPAANTTP